MCLNFLHLCVEDKYPLLLECMANLVLLSSVPADVILYNRLLTLAKKCLPPPAQMSNFAYGYWDIKYIKEQPCTGLESYL